MEKKQVSKKLATIKNLSIRRIHITRNTVIAVTASAATFVTFTVLIVFNILNPQPSLFIPFWITMITIGAALLLLRRSTGSNSNKQPPQLDNASTPIDQPLPQEASETMETLTQVNNPADGAILEIRERLDKIDQRETEIIGLINHLSPAKPETSTQVNNIPDSSTPTDSGKNRSSSQANQPESVQPVKRETRSNATQESGKSGTQTAQIDNTRPPLDSPKPQFDTSKARDATAETCANTGSTTGLEVNDAPQDGDEEEIATYLEKMDNYTERLAQIRSNLSELKSGIMAKIDETYGASGEA